MRAVAVVGMACRFAGAPDLQAFWRLLRDGGQAFGPVPADRWDAAAFSSATARDPDRTTAPAGAFLDDVRSFPAVALGIPPRRVEVMDPQQRMTLEVGLQAIEDAGRQPADLPRNTGVYVGITAHEYRVLQGARTMALLMASGQLGQVPEDLEALAAAVENVVPVRPFSAPGALGNMAAAILAQELDLTGPAYTLDAACASAMVAVADAVAHLRTGQIDTALAGGAYLQLNPEHYVAFSRIGAMSSSGVCRPFDAEADGFVQGDGVGMLVLRRLEDAQRDGDRIYAVIRGVAVNNDGRGDGPMAPRREGQVAVVRDAWRDAEVEPRLAEHVETHGTGTSVGDATELDGLREALGGARVVLGSSKANIGHTMSAAGIAGLLAAALSIHHRTHPPLAGFRKAKPELGDLEGDGLTLPRGPVPWTTERRLTGVSSFGFGGTNGHAVLEGVPAAPAPTAQPELVLLSAPSEAALRTLAGSTAQAIRDDPTASVAGVARAWAGRRRQAWRAGLVVADREALLTALDALAEGGTLPAGTVIGEAGPAPRVGFLFPGQGAQRLGMLQGLAARFPQVATALDDQQQALDGTLTLPLTHLLWPETRATAVDEAEAAAQLTATEHCQPAMLAAGLALARLLRAVGLEPAAVAGHSLGEFAAAAVAGVLTEAEAARFVARRGLAMAALPGDPGAMAALRAPAAEVEALLVPGAVLANLNHPRQTVVSGRTDAVAAVVEAAEAAGVAATRLDVSHAFHSPVLDGLDATTWLEGIHLQDPTVPVVSAISAAPYADARDAREVFVRHATSPVRFTAALEAMVDDGVDVLLQVGAGGPLASFARGTVGARVRAVLTLAPLEDDPGGAGLLATLAELWVLGAHLDARALAAEAPLASLPPTPLPREVYWAIKDEPTKRLVLDRGTPPQPATAPNRPAQEVAAGPATATSTTSDAAPAGDGDDAVEGVLDVVARVSAYPRGSLQQGSRLVEDLGFDSLMMGDLATGLAERFPGVGPMPQELLINQPTVGALVAFVQSGGAVAAPDDDAPLAGWTLGWRSAPLPDLPERPLPAGPWVVSGPSDDATLAVADRLARSGREVRPLPPDEAAQAEASVLVWVDQPDRPSPVEVAGGTVPLPCPAAELLPVLAAHARRGRTPDVVALTRPDDPWAQGLAGALRSLAREWPTARVLHLAADALFEAVDALREELQSADRSVDVRRDDGRRLVPSFTPWHPPADPTATAPVGSDDVVLVTGGTRGIGLDLGLRLAALGAGRVLLLGRSAPGPDAGLAAFPQVEVVQADVTDAAALAAAVGDRGITVLVHAAGVLADGPVQDVSADALATAHRVKVAGWLHALAACGPTLRRATALGSWAGRFGNRHQAAYAAANASLAALVATTPRATIAEYGPWTGSAMADTIPAPVRQRMRAQGVDFVGREAGLEALVQDLAAPAGVLVRGRRVPDTTRQLQVPLHLDTTADPYLLDHAIEGTPVLPLAAVADLLAWASARPTPLEVRDLTLFAGVTVSTPVDLVLEVEGERALLRSADGTVHDTATVRALTSLPEVPPSPRGGAAPALSLREFYDHVTFHGPKLQGIERIERVGDDFVVGVVRTGQPRAWSPGTAREAFVVDPLALDSALQLAAYVAWIRYRRAGTPVSIGRLSLLAPLAPATAHAAEVWFGEASEDRFSATVVLRDAAGNAVLVAQDVVAELRRVAEDDGYTPPADVADVARWPEVADLGVRLEGVSALGLENPYFHVHEGTARNTTVVAGRELVNFSSYNYVGLSGDPRVLAAVHEAVDRYGTSVSASRVASGERPFHGELEAELAAAQGAEAALLFTAGHATNVTTIGHLVGPEDLVLHDAYIHDSALQGIKLSGAVRRAFRHADADHLAAQLRDLRPRHRRCLIVVEGVYSMDGDLCDLPRFVELKKRHGALLMVDEAHSFGVVGATGRGIGEHHGLDGREIDLWMGTLSKSLASCGGWIAGSSELIRYLRYTAPGFVYSAGLTAANGVAALASLRLMLEEPERVQRLQANAARFHAACVARGLDTGPARGGSAVIPVVTGNSLHALVLSQRLLERGINVQPIVYPAVADDASRLRFFLSSTHTDAQLDATASTVADVLAEVRRELPVP
ncbi:MAG: aminotransferase class I/II-fold pyridoxal phosphate-dependent enzyme [Alphaproteobacteria bacterium]|nr:aminotransferase class I/II-fold pyridoxal phosphate-dependent enzyme [Alphaproteobacteria bacterium]